MKRFPASFPDFIPRPYAAQRLLATWITLFSMTLTAVGRRKKPRKKPTVCAIREEKRGVAYTALQRQSALLHHGAYLPVTEGLPDSYAPGILLCSCQTNVDTKKEYLQEAQFGLVLNRASCRSSSCMHIQYILIESSRRLSQIESRPLTPPCVPTSTQRFNRISARTRSS